MKKNLIPVLFCFVFAIFAHDLSAKSSNRKGFVFGLGVGGGLTLYETTEYQITFLDVPPYVMDRYVDGSGSSPGLATDFKIGYGISDKLMLLYTNKVLWFSFQDPDWSEAQATVTGASMLSMTYFFKPTAPSLFASAGAGVSTWGAFPATEEDESWLGLGLFAGVGFEFAPHWMIEFTSLVGLGGTDDDDDSGKNPFTFMVTIHWLLY